MYYWYAVLWGALFASGFFGVWWLTVILGIGITILRPSYVLPLFGLVIDITFSPHIGSGSFLAFFTAVFLSITVSGKLVHGRLLWSKT
ncbi:MAG: hypothetical protein Q8P16_00725 [bacterium]|nr:hypothetical protein [bacterium]